MTRKNKVYPASLKLKVAEEFSSGKATAIELCKKYDIKDTKRIYVWTRKYNSGDTEFKDTRGKASKGRTPKIKPISEMSKDEYIEYLELENKILKGFAEMLESKKK